MQNNNQQQTSKNQAATSKEMTSISEENATSYSQVQAEVGTCIAFMTTETTIDLSQQKKKIISSLSACINLIRDTQFVPNANKINFLYDIFTATKKDTALREERHHGKTTFFGIGRQEKYGETRSYSTALKMLKEAVLKVQDNLTEKDLNTRNLFAHQVRAILSEHRDRGKTKKDKPTQSASKIIEALREGRQSAFEIPSFPITCKSQTR